MIHPAQAQLALFSGGDLSWIENWRVRRHLARCAECRREADGFRKAEAALVADAASIPAGLDWDRLSEEMTANIHLGLEAGECVARPRSAPLPVSRWRAAAVMATAAAVVLGAWALNPAIPRRAQPSLRAAHSAEIRNTATGLELNENGGALVLLHGRDAAQKPIIVSVPGALRARFVDSDTGQITITHVYAE